MLLKEQFYKARLEDLQIGQTFYQKIGELWRPSIITRSDYLIQPTGQNNIMIMVNNIVRFENKEEDFYRVKFLNGDDIENLGFSYMESKVPDTVKRIYTNTRFHIHYYPKNKRIDIYEVFIVRNKDIVANKEEDHDLIFTGQILNTLELVTILKTTGVMYIPARKELFNTKQL